MRGASRVVPLRINPIVGAILQVAGPCNHEVATGIHADLALLLDVTGGRVDSKLRALGHTRGVVALCVDAEAAAILQTARPGDDKAIGAHGNGGVVLIVGRVGVHPEFSTLGHASSVVALRIDAARAGVLPDALPGHHKVACAVHGHGGHVLSACGVGVDLEFGRRSSSVGVVAPPIDIQRGGIFPDHHIVATGVGSDLLA